MTAARARIILDTKKPATADKIVTPIAADIGAVQISSAPYVKGGTEVMLEVPLSSSDWPAQILELIRIAQYLGYGWHITGSIDDSISLTSEKFRITGISWACIETDKDD